MTQLKILIDNRNYDKYQIVNATTFEPQVIINFDAITNIVVAEKKNLYGVILETAVQVLTPKNQPQ